MKLALPVALAAAAALLTASGRAAAQDDGPAAAVGGQNRLIFVTIDGVRWQELFHGAASRVIDDPRRTPDRARVRKAYLTNQPAEALTPFLHSVEKEGGVLLGNRDKNYCMRVGNRYWFSYPGYNEMLTGKTDTWANTNDPVVNPDITILEWLNAMPGYAGKVRAYATWDNFRNILNQKRSRIPVNDPSSPLPASVPAKGDARTQALALQSLRTEDPRVLFVGFGETDEVAHEGHYDRYLEALHAADGYIRELWQAAQADPHWAGHTTLIVTTDHGRGLADLDNENWRRHSSGIDAAGVFHPEDSWPGSDQTWAAYLGPRPVEPTAKPAEQLWPCSTTSQVAATAIEALDLKWTDFNPRMSPPLVRFQKP